MLSELQDKFVLEKAAIRCKHKQFAEAELDKAEFEKQSAHEQTLMSLKNEQSSEEKAVDKKAALKNKKLQQKAQLDSNLKTTKATKDSDELGPSGCADYF